VPNLAAGSRLLDLLTLLESDYRLQVIFTVPDAMESWNGVDEFVREHAGLVLPWRQAVQHCFDLVLAASYTQLEWIRGRILVVPHGASSLMSRKFNLTAGPDAMPHLGLSRETLVSKGRLIPSVLALTHDAELVALRRSCPAAVSRAIVAGDICMDRMIASRPMRNYYRRALGVGASRRLVTVSSSWSTDSTFGQHPELCRRLLAELPRADYCVALVLHPNIWAVHGRRQVMAWLAGCVGDGLLVIPPAEGWRAAIVASDWVIGDHGSTTQYAAGLGKPVLLATFPSQAVRAGSIADAVAAIAPRLDVNRPVLSQLWRAAESHSPDDYAVAQLITSRLGRSAALLRNAMYGLLELPEPAEPAQARPVPVPRPVRPFPGIDSGEA
jgi:hypothetical protein